MPDALPAAPLTDPLLRTVLKLSRTAIYLLEPFCAAAGNELTDFQLAYLNPAAQRLTGLPEQPNATLQAAFPAASADGLLAFCRRVFETGEAGCYDYQGQADDGVGRPWQLTAERQGPHLVVSLTEQADRSRRQVEEALHASQAREQAAHAEAERQRSELQRVFEQAPLAIAVYRGPNYTIELANPTVARLWGRTQAQLIGKGLFEALPEVAGMGYEQLLDEVMATGTPHVARAMAAQHDRNGHRETVYWDFVYVPLREAGGQITGAMVVATEVTEQVQARQQLQQLNEELELRVTARSAEVRAALFEAEEQREQARRQQALLGQILGQVPAAIATLTGPQHRYSFFNEPYQALVNGRAALGRPVAEVLLEVEEQGFVALLDQVYATGQPFTGTDTPIMLQHPATGAAELHYLDFVYQPLFDGRQQPQGVLAFVVDVTEKVKARKQAETLQAAMLAAVQRQGRERENVYQLFEQAPAAICLLREPDHRINYLNPAYQALFPGQTLRGKTLAAAQPTAAALVTLFDGIYQGGQTRQQREVPVVIPSSAGLLPHTRYYDFTYQAYREDGRIAGVSIFGFDVTERVLATQSVLDNARRLRLLTDALPVLIAYVDREQRYQFNNQAYQRWFDLDPAQLRGQLVQQVIGEDAYREARPYIERALAGELVTFESYMPYRPDWGRHIHTSFVPDVQQGEVRGFYSLVSDVTDQMLAREQVQALNQELAAINGEVQATNEELQLTNARLLRTNADLDTFVYTASHDLKAPIANIEGLLEALRADLPPPVLQEPHVPRLLDMMQGSVERFQQTIGHLAHIAQLQQAEAPASVHLPDLIEGVRLDLAPLIEAAAATLVVAVDGCEAVHVAPKTLRSVTYNLLSNALKYRAPERPPQVHLRAHCGPGRLVLEVQDNGLGLTPRQQDQLFGMFRRLHTHVEGSGVGLYMVKRMVENAGGTITVQSQVGVGSTFSVSLPA